MHVGFRNRNFEFFFAAFDFEVFVSRFDYLNLDSILPNLTFIHTLKEADVCLDDGLEIIRARFHGCVLEKLNQ